MKRPKWSLRAFTAVEVFVVIVVVVILVAILLPAMTPSHNHGGRAIKDSSQLRGVVQAMSIWAGNNKDQYPLPSAIDLNDDTIAESGRAKDTTANIMSMMIYNGSLPTDLLVSSAEANPNVSQYTTYEYNSPKTAVRPDKAMWDPAFNVDFTGSKPGGLSYAHLMPSRERLGRWTNSFSATEAIVGNRGPEIASVTKKTAPAVDAAVRDPGSYTFLIHGARTTWEGNIGFNDAHVEFMTTFDPVKASDGTWGTYTGTDGKKWSDLIFYDEPDDASKTNSFMSIFTTAGDDPSAFKAIWD